MLDAKYGSFLTKPWDNDITVICWMSKIYKNHFKFSKRIEKVNYLKFPTVPDFTFFVNVTTSYINLGPFRHNLRLITPLRG